VEGAPDGKLKQMLSYGAHLTRIAGFGASPETNIQVMGGLKDLAVELNAGLEISAYTFSPRGMAGVMTLSFEIAERLDPGPLHIFCPAGGGGLTLAVARGFELLNSKSLWNGSARVHCVQPKGNDTIASALRNGAVSANAVQSMTAVSGLQVGNVLDGDEAIRACRRSGGQGYTVSDDQVWECQSRLALEEGIFCEPAGAVGLAGLFSAISKGEVERDEVTVCLVTGSGFKDARALDRMVGGNGAGLVSNFAEFANKARGQLKTK
jgi:threonine synthase